MDLSFSELKKREVININDGRSLGHPNDIVLSFPAGTMTGIVVPGKKVCFLLRPFKSSKDIYIARKNIQKIGSDVILVNVSSGIIPTDLNNNKKCCPPNSFIENTTVSIEDSDDI